MLYSTEPTDEPAMLLYANADRLEELHLNGTGVINNGVSFIKMEHVFALDFDFKNRTG